MEVKKKVGRLYYNADEKRYGLLCNDDWYISGFHCGQILEIWLDGEWTPARIEYSDDWYLVGYPDLNLQNLKARY